jgi:hypothetical protein
VEVSHGPYVVDHNVLASPVSVELFSQGGAFVNNLVAGLVRLEAVMDRATPYHRPHSTQVAGYAVVYGGDDRWVGNLFVGDNRPGYAQAPPKSVIGHGTAVYNGHPASFAQYRQRMDDLPPGDVERFFLVPQPVYIRDNTYVGAAVAYEAEQGARVLEGPASAQVVIERDGVYLEAKLPAGFDDARVRVVSGADLVAPRLVGLEYEERDGSPLVIDRDLVGQVKDPGGRYPAGPLARLTSGVTRTRLAPGWTSRANCGTMVP